MIREHTSKSSIKFYVLVGFESTDIKDIENAFVRIELLMKYKCVPYIMRYQSQVEMPWKQSEFRGMYINLARWCNQPSFFKKKSFREFCIASGGASIRYMDEFEKKYPCVAERYFDMRW